MGEQEERAGEGVVRAAGLLRLEPVADLPGPPADQHRAGLGRDPGDGLARHDVGQRPPVHRVAGTGDEPVERHRPVHDDLAPFCTRVAHPLLPDSNSFQWPSEMTSTRPSTTRMAVSSSIAYA